MAHARVLATAIGVVVFAVCALSAPDANAGTSGSQQGLAATAASLESRVLSTAHQLHEVAVESDEASARLSAANAAVSAGQADLARLQGELGHARQVLREVALDAYEHSGDTAAVFPFSATPADEATSKVYEEVIAGSETDAVDQFAHEEAAVASQQAVLAAERDSAASDYSALNAEHTSLEADASDEQSMLNQVQAQESALAAQARRAALAAALVRSQTQGTPSTIPVSTLTGAPNPSLGEDLARLRECESGDNYQDNTGNGYYGAYQFALSTWQDLGYGGLPSEAPPPTQDEAATRLVQSDGWGQWPVCAALLGLH